MRDGVGVVVIEAGVAAGYVIASAMRKARRAAGRLDAEVDTVIDAGLDKLHDLVADRLGTPVLETLQEEAAGEQVSELTRQQVELALTAAASRDDTFGHAITALITELREAEQATGQTAIGQAAANVGRDVSIHAEDGSAAAWSMGTVNLTHTTTGSPPSTQPPGSEASGDPSSPGRTCD